MKVSRRQVLLAAAVTASAQAPPKPNPDQESQAARSALQSAALAISGVPLPMAVEPAFYFKA